MSSGVRKFSTGETLTSAYLNDYLMQQTVMVFDSAAARDAMFTSAGVTVTEGMLCYLRDVDKTFVYTGSAWLFSATPQTTEIGAWQSWNPSLSASSGIISGFTINRARYCIINKLCIAHVDVTITAAGTAAGAYLFITMPVTASSINATTAMRETAVNGSIYSWQMHTNSSSIVLSYTGGGVIATGARFPGVMTYEIP